MNRQRQGTVQAWRVTLAVRVIEHEAAYALYVMSDTNSQHDEQLDLDQVEAELAEIELMLERLDKPNG